MGSATRRPFAPANPTAQRHMGPVWAALALLLSAPGCAPAAELPSLPGVTDESRVWFWRDVLAAPLPGETGPDRAVLVLNSPAERVDALAELVMRDDPAALSTCLAALRDESVGVACAAAEGLARLRNQAAIPRLLKGLGPHPVDFDGSIHVRAAEAAALCALGNPAGIPLILTLLEEDTSSEANRADLPWEPTQQLVFLRELALPGLVALAGTDFGYEPNGSVPARGAAARKARDWWEQQRERLWAAAPLDHPGAVTRARLLVHHLGAYQLRQIDGARFALTHLGPAVLSQLQEGLQSEDTYVRLHVLEVMEQLCSLSEPKIRSRLAVVAAIPLLEDADPRVAAQAASVCAAARIIDPLVAAVGRRSHPAIQLALVDALGRSGLPLAHEILQQSYEQAPLDEQFPRGADFEVAVEAALLGTDPARAPSAFLAMLSSKDPDVVYPALERLILYTGSDHGLDPASPPAERTAALDSALRALSQRDD